MYTDKQSEEEISLLGNSYGQIFTTSFVYLSFVILSKKGETDLAMSEVFQ